MQAVPNTSPTDAVLVHAVLSYLGGSLAASPDPRLAQAFGVSPKLARRIMDLTTTDLMLIATKGAHCIKIKIDEAAFDGLLETVGEEGNDITAKHACIEAGASREMMTALFGVTHREYARLRQMLGMGRGNGRPRECTPDDADRIFEAWQKQGGRRDARSLLTMARELCLPLRLVWEELAQYGPDFARTTKAAAEGTA